jgi:hypothetical protein
MIKVWKFLSDYWFIPFFIFSIFLFYFFRKKTNPPIQKIKNELEVIQAGRKANELIITEGYEKAKEAILSLYYVEKDQLSKKQQIEAERLKNDPIELSKLLVRASHNSQ